MSPPMVREGRLPRTGGGMRLVLPGPPGSVAGGPGARRLGAENLDRSPDGQFYVDLRGSTGESGPEPAAEW